VFASVRGLASETVAPRPSACDSPRQDVSEARKPEQLQLGLTSLRVVHVQQMMLRPALHSQRQRARTTSSVPSAAQPAAAAASAACSASRPAADMRPSRRDLSLGRASSTNATRS